MLSNLQYHSFYTCPPVDKLLQLIALDQLYFPYPWSKSAWEKLEVNSGEYFFGIILQNDVFVGFSLYLLSPQESLAHLLKLLVLPQFRGQGIAKIMLERDKLQLIDSRFERSYLEVAADNKQAIATYLSCGYRQIHLQKRYYSDGRDAVMMEAIF